MKYIFTTLIMAIAVIIHSQSNSSQNQDSILYLTDAQEAFMIDKETKYLFKTGPIGYEQKLSNSFSINTAFQPTYSGDSGFKLKAGADLRYYYKLDRLIKEGKQANNLSSEYFSTGIEYDGIFPNNNFNGRTINYKVSWGSQKRFLNYGYFDYNLSLGYNDTKFDYSIFGLPVFRAQSISLSTKTAVGFAFGKRYKIDDIVKCPIFKCHLDRKAALKVNFNKVFNIAYGTNTIIDEKYRLTATFNPNISYEHKIGSSSFSIEQDLDILVGFSSKISKANPKAGLSRYRIGYTATLRHYFQMKSNIRKGKSGNNLSGYYWFLSGSFQYGDSELPLYDENIAAEVGKHKFWEIPFGVGYQKTMLNDYYFDFKMGLNLRVEGMVITEPKDIDLYYTPFIADFKVGKLF